MGTLSNDFRWRIAKAASSRRVKNGVFVVSDGGAV